VREIGWGAGKGGGERGGRDGWGGGDEGEGGGGMWVEGSPQSLSGG